MTKPQALKLLHLTLERMEACGGHHVHSLVQLRQIGERLLNEHRGLDFKTVSATLRIMPNNQVFAIPPVKDASKQGV